MYTENPVKSVLQSNGSLKSAFGVRNAVQMSQMNLEMKSHMNPEMQFHMNLETKFHMNLKLKSGCPQRL